MKAELALRNKLLQSTFVTRRKLTSHHPSRPSSISQRQQHQRSSPAALLGSGAGARKFNLSSSHLAPHSYRPAMDATDDIAERFESAQPQPKGKKGASAGGGAGGGAGGAAKKAKDISRALSRLLRHQATNAGIMLDEEGYAPLDKVLLYGPVRSLKATVQDIIAVTADNEKQRFSMKPANPDAAPAESDPAYWLIRANQGHSIPLESESLLTPLTLDTVPAVVVHGTYFAFWERIVESGGLRRMGRNHVHCSTGLPEDGAAGVVSGMRDDAELLVYLDVRQSLQDGSGMTWWVSENGVVLTEGLDEEGVVPVKYFKEVVGRKEDVGTLWKDGEKVADLPEGLKARAPSGKSGARGRGGARGGRGRGRGRGRGNAVPPALRD